MINAEIVKQFAVGGLDDNFSYVINGTDGICGIVDPAGDLSVLIAFVKEQGATVKYIFVTHSHHDHIEGIGEIVGLYPNTEIIAHKDVQAPLDETYKVQHVEDDDTVVLGGISVRVLYTPGHMADAVCYLIATSTHHHLVTGDTLFVEGCGRTTPEESRHLYASLRRLKALSRTTRIYPGHDYGSKPVSNLNWELLHNRFLRAEDYDTFYAQRFPEG